MNATTMTEPRVLSELLALAESHLWSGTKNESTAVSNARDVVTVLGPQTSLDPEALPGYPVILTHELRKRGLAPATINRKLSAFSALMGLAVDLGVLQAKPKIRWQKEPAGRVRYLTGEEEDGILLELPDHIADLCVFLVETGLRRGEALALTWADVEEDAVAVRESKSGRARRVPLTNRAKQALPKPWTHETPFGGIRPNALTYAWNKAVKRAGITGDQVVPHILRHTCASRLVQRAVPLPVVKEWMGHADIKTTMRYAHIGNEHLEAARDALEKD